VQSHLGMVGLALMQVAVAKPLNYFLQANCRGRFGQISLPDDFHTSASPGRLHGRVAWLVGEGRRSFPISPRLGKSPRLVTLDVMVTGVDRWVSPLMRGKLGRGFAPRMVTPLPHNEYM